VEDLIEGETCLDGAISVVVYFPAYLMTLNRHKILSDAILTSYEIGRSNSAQKLA
jgi:hypothetical protein